MCVICGCEGGDTAQGQGVQDHGHDHGHDHEREHGYDRVTVHPGTGDLHYGAGPARVSVPGLSQARAVRIEQSVLGENNRYAAHNRKHFTDHNVLALNLVSSPGSGKTTLLCATINALREQSADLPVGVIEGDQQTSHDADRIRATGAPAIQINTGKGCHLDARMVDDAFHRLPLHHHHGHARHGAVLFIENVGNLVCPAMWDLGETAKVAILSVTEGEDKPLKYPDMFAAARLMILNKIDLLPYLHFDVARCIEYARRINPAIEVLQLSASSGEGMADWLGWIDRQRSALAAPADPVAARIAALERELAAVKAQVAGG
ncbi:Hydrogenase maturation factor HypB (plasmid) [Cupriavidus necator]|uniref:hydrogenase nickel incorporation protein HypB n=1 Tax=Cupriavidus necator TaxID=106590 RepID=UPI003F736809